MPKLIAFVGAMGSGKSTAAQYAVRTCGYTRYRIAEPIKAMMYALGLNEEQVDGSEKNRPCDLLCGQTPRHAMQTLGTEWRDMIDKNLWLNIAEHKITTLLASGSSVAVDDIRFPHEAALIKKLGGSLYRIRRNEAEDKCGGHASEQHWRSLEVDGEIHNEFSPQTLYHGVYRALCRTPKCLIQT